MGENVEEEEEEPDEDAKRGITYQVLSYKHLDAEILVFTVRVNRNGPILNSMRIDICLDGYIAFVWKCKVYCRVSTSMVK